MDPYILLIFGPPGSGKSTQADLAAEEFGAVHLNAGAILRELFSDKEKENLPEVKAARAKYDAGELIDYGLMSGFVVEKVEAYRKEGRIIVFSGNPRSVPEAKLELPTFKELYGDRIFFASLVIREETTIERNSKRRICSKCGNIYSKSDSEICPTCGGILTTRSDDDPEIIKKRLQVYRELTTPLFEYFSELGIPKIEIDGEPSPSEVFESLKKSLLPLLS